VILNLSLVGRLNLQLHSALIAFRKSLRHSTIKMKNLTILLLEDSVVLTNKDWRDFSETFESVHPGFFQRLGEKFAELTPAEIRFMILARLQFSVKEMAAVLGVSGEAIRQMRYRIKKKLHCLKDDDLGDLMQTV
jgi:DNA-directed RNA polymerase specialized sigma24 family protein